MEQDKLMWFKNQNTRTKNKNTRCVKQTWKQIFIMLTYANVNMKRIWQGYGARSCVGLMLNILKEMKAPIPIYTPFGTNIKEASKKVSRCASNKEASWEPS
jgi:hypothetical protein